MSALNFTFLKDEPLNKDGDNFFNFYHSTIAPALKKILKSDTAPHTIGLFGSWGTGKSTIIEMLSKDTKLGMPIFVFDAWKYQKDALRRTFLIKFVEFARSLEGSQIDENILKPLYTSTTRSITNEVNAQKPQSSKGHKFLLFLKRKALPLVVGTSILGWILLSIFAKNNSAVVALKEILTAIAGVSFITIVLKPVIEGVVKQALERFFSSLKAETELRTQTEYEERFNSPEQFEEKFKQIVGQLNKKMVIVFDNIDRVPGDIAISMLSTIKTFMEPSKGGGLVFIIPCDAAAIEHQIAEYYRPQTDAVDGDEDDFVPTDYLRKVFNLVMWVPEFVNTDMEEYTKKCLAATGEIKQLLEDEDVVLVINSAFSKNPREIIQFINNLIAVVVAAQETEVRDRINGNIAYLAKVLVLRQKFPKAYRRLKEHWYRPENIINGDEKDKNLVNFMNLTSRITVDDAEPYIYFKNPASSRGLDRSEDLKSALVAANTETASEIVKGESNKEAVVDFITDLLVKYWGQEKVLLNIFSTQFVALKDNNLTTNKRRYYENLVRTLDTQLWTDYKKLPTDDVFDMLSSSSLTNKLRSDIVGRYVTAIKDQADDKDFDLAVLENFRRKPELLDTDQGVKVRAAIEEKYGKDRSVISMFKGIEEQERFITKQTIDDFIATIDSPNIVGRLTTLEGYKDFILRQKQLEPLILRFSERLKNENAVNSDFTENKGEIIKAIPSLVKTYRSELDGFETAMGDLSNELVRAFSGAGSWEHRVLIVIAMWWVETHAPSQQRSDLIASIKTFFSSGTTQGPIDVIKYWDDVTKANFIRQVIDVLLPRFTSEAQLLEYMYAHAGDATKQQIISYLIQNTPLDTPYDLNFIKGIDRLPDRLATVRQLLARVARFTYNHKPPYYEYLAGKLYKNDPRDVKDLAIEQARSLIKNDDPNFEAVGYNFLANAKFLSDSDKRNIASDVLAWLREPGKTVDNRHRLAMKTITNAFNDLQTTPQNDFIYMLFNLLEPNAQQPSIEVVMEILKELNPQYRAYEKDFEDLLSRLQNWPSQQTRDFVVRELQAFRSSKPNTKEKAFWSKLEGLQPEAE